MKTPDTLSTLRDWSPEVLHEFITLLNQLGIVSDEDRKGLSSTMVENWHDACEAFIRTKGYVGGTISSCGQFFAEHGAVYVLYDEERHSYHEARRYLAEVANRAQDS